MPWYCQPQARAITDAYVRYFSGIMTFFDDANYFLAL
jgi:hypothetical protein